MKVYRSAARAARNYAEAHRSPADDYYLAGGSGLAMRFVARSDAATDSVDLERRADLGPTNITWAFARAGESQQGAGRPPRSRMLDPRMPVWRIASGNSSVAKQVGGSTAHSMFGAQDLGRSGTSCSTQSIRARRVSS
jgi:hypothetical protein